ncbi:unnamed protein product [Adineta steineri]|uniref:Uncharacterized protein n=1 Tax=Adineta steineri TaxID=433720 RepID=A0A815MVX7_9BILA|nr:unnamed protein product [Adineta steineri]
MRQCYRPRKSLVKALNGLSLNVIPTDLAWTNPLSVSSLKNQSLKNILPKLFVEEWSTNISYSKYFIQCAPVSCTYTETDQISLFYTISFFLSIYGGLCIILRSTALFLIYVWMKLKRYSINNNNNNINIGIYFEHNEKR